MQNIKLTSTHALANGGVLGQTQRRELQYAPLVPSPAYNHSPLVTERLQSQRPEIGITDDMHTFPCFGEGSPLAMGGKNGDLTTSLNKIPA